MKFMKEILLTKEEMVFLVFFVFYHFTISDRAKNQTITRLRQMVF